MFTSMICFADTKIIIINNKSLIPNISILVAIILCNVFFVENSISKILLLYTFVNSSIFVSTKSGDAIEIKDKVL